MSEQEISKKTSSKKVIIIIVAVLVCLLVVGAILYTTVFKKEDKNTNFEGKYIAGKNITLEVEYVGSDKRLTIDGNGVMWNNEQYEKYCEKNLKNKFEQWKEINDIKISNTVTELSSSVKDLSAVSKIEIPETVQKIDYDTFHSVTNADIYIYNSKCEINYIDKSDKTQDVYCYTLGSDDGSVTIHGYKGSTAEKYVKEWNKISGSKYKFEVIK